MHKVVTTSIKSKSGKFVVVGRKVKRKKSNIASMQDIAETMRELRKKKIAPIKVSLWKRSVFLVYDYGQAGMFFYHIPDEAMTDRDFDRVLRCHRKKVNVDDDKHLMWLHNRLMHKSMIYDAESNQATKNGRWYKYRIPSDKPFGIKGDFLVITTGFAD